MYNLVSALLLKQRMQENAIDAALSLIAIYISCSVTPKLTNLADFLSIAWFWHAFSKNQIRNNKNIKI